MPSGSLNAGPASLTLAERTRLVAILDRLGSDFEGERAAAGLLASRMLQERQLTWDALLLGREAQEATSREQADLDLCRRHRRHLNAWEAEFVAALARWRKPRTLNQTAKLAQVAAELRARGFA